VPGLSTDSSNALDPGGRVRVGYTPMDRIKLTAELLAEGWSHAELDRMTRAGSYSGSVAEPTSAGRRDPSIGATSTFA
jgi:hypothetical protein